MVNLIDDVVRREGGHDVFSDRPADRGGPTRAGITLPALSHWLGFKATVEDLKRLSREDIRRFYYDEYLDPFLFIINEQLRALCFDYAVNSGVKTAIRALQRAANVDADGVVGPVTMRAVNQGDATVLFSRVFRDRLERYLKLALDEPITDYFLRTHPRAQLNNLRGWCRRLSEFV